ncbi:MAG TPA: discoidin domain-containing protein [Polyangiaceae bacterium]|nr:discoidin domain-containing protein [Polyangiaceae bacterium]
MPDRLARSRIDYARAALELGDTLRSARAARQRPELVALALANVRAAIRCLGSLPDESALTNDGESERDGDARATLDTALRREPLDALLAVDEASRDLERLLAHGKRLLDARERPLHLARAARRKALARWLVPALALVAALAWVAHGLFAPRVISNGKHWTTSSVAWPCDPVGETCGGSKTKILFHTLVEKDPWFELDLGKPYAVSGVSLKNRSDCCADRAVPLVVETSLDHASYRAVARRFTEFDRYAPRFAPVRARYVRVRVTRTSMLHLEQVLVYGEEVK